MKEKISLKKVGSILGAISIPVIAGLILKWVSPKTMAQIWEYCTKIFSVFTSQVTIPALPIWLFIGVIVLIVISWIPLYNYLISLTKPSWHWYVVDIFDGIPWHWKWIDEHARKAYPRCPTPACHRRLDIAGSYEHGPSILRCGNCGDVREYSDNYRDLIKSVVYQIDRNVHVGEYKKSFIRKVLDKLKRNRILPKSLKENPELQGPHSWMAR